MTAPRLRVDDFDYDLPPTAIAQTPAEPRDAARLLVLRTGSNYSMPPTGGDAVASLVAEAGGLSALQPSLDAAFTVGSRVIDALATGWGTYRDTIPGQGGRAGSIAANTGSPATAAAAPAR